MAPPGGELVEKKRVKVGRVGSALRDLRLSGDISEERKKDKKMGSLTVKPHFKRNRTKPH